MSALQFLCHRQKNWSKRYAACDHVAAGEGFKPSAPRCAENTIEIHEMARITNTRQRKINGPAKNKTEAHGFSFERRSGGMSALQFLCHRQKNRSKRYAACSDVAAGEGFEFPE